MNNKELIQKYLEFKKECLELSIYNIEEIMKLFEVALKNVR